MHYGVSNLSGIEKTAILFITLGPERSSTILKLLPESMIEKITFEISNITHVESIVKNSILNEFVEINKTSDYIKQGGIDYAKDILTKALGLKRAEEIITSSERLAQRQKPFINARRADSFLILKTIVNEHPQTIALVLCFLQPEKAAAVISGLPENLKSDVAYRIATMSKTSPKIIKQVEGILDKKLSNFGDSNFETYGGVKTLVSILNSVNRVTEKNIVDELAKDNRELADKIKENMFVFEDIITLDSASIQKVLREVEMSELAVALKGASRDVTGIVFKNMSTRAGVSLQEDIDLSGPVRLATVEESQHKIVAIIRRLDEAGEVYISRGKDDAVIE